MSQNDQIQALEVLQPIFPHGVFAVARGLTRDKIIPIVEALHRGGIRAIEITLNTPQALAMIFDLRSHFGERMVIGAGTVRSVQEADEAYRAGAQFLVSPHTDPEIIAKAMERNIASIPGAFTPTEIMQAWNAGARVIKLFPMRANLETYIKELKGPFHDIPFIVMGGVNASNIKSIKSLGIFAAGIGSELFPAHAIEKENYDEVEQAAHTLINASVSS